METNTNEKPKEIKVIFGDINRNNFHQLEQINNLSLPVRYSKGFYLRITNKLRHGRFAYYNDFIVGAITWKYDICAGERSIYIMTINVLEDYKRNHIGKP
jgi:hypothetical protein